MKSMIRALAGIAVTILIVMLVERTIASFEFFPEDNDDITNKTDSLSDTINTADLQPKKQINPTINNKNYVKVDNKTVVVANKVYKKLVPVTIKEEYIKNVVYEKTIPNYTNEIDVSFEFEDNGFEDDVLFIVLDSYNEQNEEKLKRFFEPVGGVNNLRLKKKISEGKHTFRLGFFLKKHAKSKSPRFYHKEFKIEIE